MTGEAGVARCPWGSSGVLRAYHDEEWGRPVAGEAALFERLCLEGAQAGLSWLTILNKREGYRAAFHGFDVDRAAAMTDDELEALLIEPGIVRNRAKIASVRTNARAAIGLRPDGGLEAFVESFAPTRTPKPTRSTQLPTTSPESVALSKALKKRGFGFVGPTTVFALMEATGIVDTHLVGCFRRGVSGRWPA
ncbi:MAG: DNA-3-methyladenine glycosylase [Marmoricola sp.]|nr:DNA-3-methyladenine glycosylase [Marmoricola sp.]